MPRTDLEAIRARLDAATPGPWIADTDTRLITGESAVLMPYVEYPRVIHVRTRNARENATLIAHAPADLAALLAYIAELESIAREVAGASHDIAPCSATDGECHFRGDCEPEWVGSISPDGYWQHHPDCPVTQARALAIPPASPTP